MAVDQNRVNARATYRKLLHQSVSFPLIIAGPAMGIRMEGAPLASRFVVQPSKTEATIRDECTKHGIDGDLAVGAFRSEGVKL